MSELQMRMGFPVTKFNKFHDWEFYPSIGQGPQAILFPFHGAALAGNLERIMSESITRQQDGKAA